MENTSKVILRLHGTVLILIGIALNINASMGAWYGIGNFSFLHANTLGFCGLSQAYMLCILTGIVLWTGSYAEKRKKWNRIGCLFHLFLLIEYAIFWNFFPTLPGGAQIRNAGFAFHIIFFLLEFWAGVLTINSKP
jgi:hypothetical protein